MTLLLFVFTMWSAYAQQKRQVNLLFAGDAMQHMPQVHAAYKGGVYHYDSCFIHIKKIIEKADIAGINFETTLAGEPYSGYPQFSSPNEFAKSLHHTGFDVFFLANNHIADKGMSGIERTLNFLDSLRVKTTGVFRSASHRNITYPMMMVKNGIRIAFLNYTYDTNGMPVTSPYIVNTIDTFQIKKDLYLTGLYQPDVIVANMHWGEEYHLTPSRKQKEIAEFLLKNGVRIIIGHHPHVVQPIEIIENAKGIESVIFYSLGNFISNQSKINTDGGALAHIAISKNMDSNEISIDSCSYTLLWVQKPDRIQRNNYRLIPLTDEASHLHSTLPLSDKQAMDRFKENADEALNASCM